MATVDPSLVAHLPLFAGFAADELGEILREARSARFTKNSAVFEQGDEAHSFFVLLHGHVRASKKSGRKIEHGVEIDFPISRQDIAQMTGTTLHTVSRILSGWEQRGLVESGRQRIVLREPHKLFVLAETVPGEGDPAVKP
jgi:CRP-like cAMP-binding protein